MKETTPMRCQAVWEEMTALTRDAFVRNYVQTIDMSDYVVETPLFPKEVLEAYSAWNLGRDVTAEQKKHFNPERGGGQGDYREGMEKKIDNVVDCLTRFPSSKRGVITISNNALARHESDTEAKCLRELHLYLQDDLEGGALNATVLFRAQAAIIFPKNIHFIGSVLNEVASRLPTHPRVGHLFYVATQLVSDRS